MASWGEDGDGQPGYWRAVLEQLPSGVLVARADGRVTYANPRAAALGGVSLDSMVGRGLAELLGLEAGSIEGAGLARLATDGQAHRVQAELRVGPGAGVLVEAALAVVRVPGAEVSLVCVLEEARHRAPAEEQIAYRASHDALTGLLNRPAFLDQLASSLEAGQQPALVFVDLDGFKEVNDSYGHQRGDEVLQVVASRLAAGIRASDVAGRYGGDEFVLLAPGLHDLDSARGYLERVATLFADPVRCQVGPPHRVSASLGLAHAEAAESTASLVRRADGAMYQAKRAKRSTLPMAWPGGLRRAFLPGLRSDRRRPDRRWSQLGRLTSAGGGW